MDIKKVTGFENMVGGMTPGTSPAKSHGPSFRDTLNRLQQDSQALRPAVAGNEPLKFSNHAVERMQSRGVRFTPDMMTKLNEAVNRAFAKGSKDSLILTDDAALIVSVKNRTVVTVMDKAALKENVFTNIDSTVVI